MNLSPQKIFISLLFGITIITTGCSSDDGPGVPTYTGPTTPAAITADNAEDIGTSNSEGTKEAVNTDTANSANPFAFAVSTSDPKVSDVVSQILYNTHKQSANLPAGVVITSADLAGYGLTTCGGSITLPDGGATSGAMVFSNLCIDLGNGEQITMNGAVAFTFNQAAGTFSFSYVNFSVTSSTTGETETLNMSVNCSTSPTFSCSISSDFIGADGSVHRITDFTVTGDPATGYNITGTFFHSAHGSVTFQTDVAITYNCPNGLPDTGTISFTGSNGSNGSITFLGDCSGYDGNWDDGTGGTGTFSGTWP